MSWSSIRVAFPSLLILASLAVPAAHAAWPPLPTGYVPICEVAGEQQTPVSAPDGEGGAIIAWIDARNGRSDLYTQRVDGQGEVRWPSGGIAVGAEPGSQSRPLVVADGAGGAIVLWQDHGDSGRLRAQRLDATGTAMWQSEVLVCPTGGGQGEASACADGFGGALVAWQEFRALTDTSTTGYTDIYAQRLGGDGVRRWTDRGVAVCTNPAWQISPTIVPDGSGGAIVCWDDGRADFDVYAQRVTAAGATAWRADGIALVTDPGYQLYHDACSDGAGGAIVVWSDGRGPEGYDIYAQRLDGSGRILWTENGLGACVSPGSQHRPAVTTDGAHGAIVAFEDQRGAEPQIRAQRIAAAGTLPWSPEGRILGARPGYQSAPRLVADGTGGAIVAWELYPGPFSTDWDLYGQRIDADGRLSWAPEGGPIHVGAGRSNAISMVSDGGSGAVLAWGQVTTARSYDIYAQHVGDVRPRAPADKGKGKLSLHLARPNPTLAGTTLRFGLSVGAQVTLAVHDERGRRVCSLVRGTLPAGEHTWRWDGCDERGGRLPSGIYFVTLEGLGERVSRRVVLVR